MKIDTSKYKNQIALFGRLVAPREEEMEGVLDIHNWRCRVVRYNLGYIVYLDWEDVHPNNREKYLEGDKLEDWDIILPMRTIAGGCTKHIAFENLYAKMLTQMKANDEHLYRMQEKMEQEARDEEEFKEYIGYLWNHR